MKSITWQTPGVNLASVKAWALGLGCGVLLTLAVGSSLDRVQSAAIGGQGSAVEIQRPTQGLVPPELDEEHRYLRNQRAPMAAEGLVPPLLDEFRIYRQSNKAMTPSDICGPSIECIHLVGQNVWDSGSSTGLVAPTPSVPGLAY